MSSRYDGVFIEDVVALLPRIIDNMSNLTEADAPRWNTSEHHGPVVSVVTWLLIIAVVLAVAARLVTRYALIKTLRWDDWTVLLATVSPSSASPLLESQLIPILSRSSP